MSPIAEELSGQFEATALAFVMLACSGGSGGANRGSGGSGGSIAVGAGDEPRVGLAGQASGATRQLPVSSASSSAQPNGARSVGGIPNITEVMRPIGGRSAGGLCDTQQRQEGQIATSERGGRDGSGGAQANGGSQSHSRPQDGQGAIAENGSAGVSTPGTGCCAAILEAIVGADPVTQLPGVTAATLAGGAVDGMADGLGAAARFSNPVSIARMPDDSLIVADYNSSLLRGVVPTTRAVTTLTTFFRAGLLQPYGFGLLDGAIVFHADKNPSHTKTTESGTLLSVDAVPGNITLLGENLGRPRSFVGFSGRRILFADLVSRDQHFRHFNQDLGNRCWTWSLCQVRRWSWSERLV